MNCLLRFPALLAILLLVVLAFAISQDLAPTSTAPSGMKP